MPFTEPAIGVGDYIAGEFHTLVLQPTTLCNLDCGYCYLPNRKRQRLMSVDVAVACADSIRVQGSGCPVDVVWHGGEPTATPIEHMRALLAPFEPLRSDGAVRHGIQTNATLIDQDWCRLFTDYGFQVGVSIDGPAWANRHRIDRAGRDSFDRIQRGINHLTEADVGFSVICVISRETIDRADELGEFFTALGCESVGFNIEEQEGSDRPAVDERAAYRFWWKLLQRRHAGSPLRVRELERLTDYVTTTRIGAIRRRPVDPIPTVAYQGDTVVLSPELLGVRDGHYGDFLAGNVLQTTIPAMLAEVNRLRYVTEFANALHTCATGCPFYDFCGGAQAGNRYFEHGTFTTAETTYCRNTRQALVRAAADYLTEGAPA